MLPPALVRLGYRLAGSSTQIAAQAVRSFQLGKPHHRRAPPAIFEASDLDRVTGVGISTTLEDQRRLIRGEERQHGAATAWELREATVSGAFLYRRALKHRLDGRDERLLKAAPAIRVPEGVLSCTYYGGLYFGHSIRDDLPLTLLAGSLGTPVRSSAKLFEHQEEYLRLADLRATPHDSAVFDRLIVVDDHHQSLDRIRRTREVRSRVRAFLPKADHTGVFINRSSTGARRSLANEHEVVQMFASRGFVIVDPGRMNALDILALVGGARLVAGVEGSHFAHGILGCADDCAFLVLQPPNRFNNVYKDFTDAMDMRYGFLVGHPVPGEAFRIDLRVLGRMLDRLQSAGAAAPSAVAARRGFVGESTVHITS